MLSSAPTQHEHADDAGGLRHAFDHQDAGKYRIGGEMRNCGSLKVTFLIPMAQSSLIPMMRSTIRNG